MKFIRKNLTTISLILISLISLNLAARTGGNFSLSCQLTKLTGSTLSSKCRKINGQWMNTSVDLGSCITNDNGALKARPSGYQNSSRKCRIHNANTLTCESKNMKGKWKQASINLNTLIGNKNGSLNGCGKATNLDKKPKAIVKKPKVVKPTVPKPIKPLGINPNSLPPMPKPTLKLPKPIKPTGLLPNSLPPMPKPVLKMPKAIKLGPNSLPPMPKPIKLPKIKMPKAIKLGPNSLPPMPKPIKLPKIKMPTPINLGPNSLPPMPKPILGVKPISGGLFGNKTKKPTGLLPTPPMLPLPKTPKGKKGQFIPNPPNPEQAAAEIKGKAFCSANCVINHAGKKKRCLVGKSLTPCKRCTSKPTNMDPAMKSVCEMVCNANLPASPCDFYGYLNNKKKIFNAGVLKKFGLSILRRLYKYRSEE